MAKNILTASPGFANEHVATAGGQGDVTRNDIEGFIFKMLQTAGQGAGRSFAFQSR